MSVMILYARRCKKMKRILSVLLAAALAVPAVSLPVSADEKATETVSYNYKYTGADGYSDEDNHTREMEKLGRGLVAVKTGDGVFLSWRLFAGEDKIYGSAAENVTFNVYRGDEKIAEVTDATNYVDTSGTADAKYSVAPVTGGTEGEKCEAVSVQENSWVDIPLTKPAQETIITPGGQTVGRFNFFPADCSAGDLDGDGEYEIVIKWTSSEHDVGSPGSGIGSLSGTVRFAAYKLDGTKLWENDINLGRNVYSSAHTVQFLVYDFNGDGKAELMCQTSLGSTDAQGKYVSHSAKTDAAIAAYTDEDNETADFREEEWGPLTRGDEFLTVFNGETGAAIDTINFPTARVGNGESFGDTSGNRSNRFVASVAYLDGEKPYAVYLRGYYFGRNGRQRTGVSGTSFDGEKLSVDYQFDTEKGQPGYYEGAYQYVGNGNHNCTVADVDNDGKDEFITGALCMEVDDENQFKPRWCTFMEHGDALHIGDYDPTVEGLEFFTIHEDGGPNTMSGKTVEINYGMTVINSNTGEIIKHWESGGDNGRGIMANIGAGGFYQVKSANAGSYMSLGGSKFEAADFGMSQNFRIFWDGDLYDELLDGTDVTDWNGNGMGRIFRADGCSKINGTKSNPGLQADLFGDWREELVYPTTDGNALRVFTSTDTTKYKMKTLMQDPVYRSGVAAEQTAYNQPPHVGFYLSEETFMPPLTEIKITSEPEKKVYSSGDTKLDLTGLEVEAVYEGGITAPVAAYEVSDFDPSTPGEQTITVTYLGRTATFTITVKEVTGVKIVTPPTKTKYGQGEAIDMTGAVIEAEFADGTTTPLTDRDYTVSGFNGGRIGEQTVTVSYAGFSASFNVTVEEADLSSLNNTYATADTSISDPITVGLGSFSNSFVIEHTFKINSMPASGNLNKDTNAGFFMRFMSATGTGGGWSLMPADDKKADIIWKDSNRNSQTITSKAPIEVGKEYTIRYAFHNVGNGPDAEISVDMYVINEKGTTIMTQTGLNLRNLSNNDQKSEPLTSVQIFNQAGQGGEASVTIDNTKIIVCGLVGVSGRKISYNTDTTERLNSISIYAAKYDSDGALSNVKKLTTEGPGLITTSIGFIPTKVFMWVNDMEPIDVWSN